MPATLAPSESIKEIDPDVAHDIGEVAELSTALLPVHLLEQYPLQLLKAYPSLQYLEEVPDQNAR